jgi:predicted aldo/keto reductase-like oxidoreductase
MNNLNRRKFLKSGLLGAAGVVALSTDLVAGAQSKQERKIIYRTLGKTGIKVPVISMGVMRADNPALVKAAYDNGIFLFDTANGYQGGKNEEMLGVVFKEYPRNSYAMATKVQPIGTGRDGLPTDATTAEDFLAKFNTSITRLGLNYVDILYMHGASTAEMVNYAPIVNAMEKLKKDGKAKFIGISTHQNQPVVIDAMVKAGIWDVVLTSYNFSMTNVKEMDEALKKANDAGMGVVAMKTMAGGFLDRERTKAVNASAALKWALSNQNVHTSIPGMTNFDHLDQNVKVMEDITMNDQEKKDVILAQAETGLFCNACRNCIPGCKNKLPIPDIMRAYMYAYGYASIDQAYNLLTDLKAGDNPCSSCDSCRVRCVKNFNVKEKITDVSRLVNVPADFIS